MLCINKTTFILILTLLVGIFSFSVSDQNSFNTIKEIDVDQIYKKIGWSIFKER
jgi:hypothetical protein